MVSHWTVCVYYTSVYTLASQQYTLLDDHLANSCVGRQERLAWGALHPSTPPLMLILQLFCLESSLNSPFREFEKFRRSLLRRSVSQNANDSQASLDH